MSDERLDRLIDDVAKQLTAGEPSSDFRARVIAGLDRRPRRGWRSIWIVAPLGALAAAVLVLVVARPLEDRDRGTESGAPRQSSQAMKTETAPAAPTPDTTNVRLKPDTTYEGPQQGIRIAGASRRQDPPEGAAAEVAALAPPPLEVPPLGVEAIGVAALPTDSIAVTRLDAIAPMSIDPLSTGEVRPPGGADHEPVEHRP